VPVKIGARRPGWVEILGGVKSGDRVVVEGLVKLKDGAKIVEAGATGTGDKPARADGG
jgi:membrane fusion protein (multidrug efflux system)